MCATRRSFCHAPTAAIALSAFLCVIVATRSDAAETPALKLLRTIQSLQARHPFLAPELLPPLIELGQLYGAGQCDRALDILELALEVSRRHEGLFNTAQLDIYDPLIRCYLTLERPADLERALRYVLLIHQAQYGAEDPRLLPVLDTVARTYEDAGLYLSARRLHRRALDLARRSAGEHHVSLVNPLRGIARAFRLEYAYGLELPDLVDLSDEATDLRSAATFDAATGTRLDLLGQRSLERAVAILRGYSASDSANRTAYLDTLLELGDWHQLANHRREALRIYRELWSELTDHVSDTGAMSAASDKNPLSAPASLLVRPRNSVHLRRPPPDLDGYRKYTIDFDYAVTRDGRVEDVTVVESNAPKATKDKAAYDLERTRFRPRFVDGEPVDTPGLYHRRNIYARAR